MIPISGIAVVAFLAVKVGVKPGTDGVRDELASIVRIIPAARFAEPEGAERGIAGIGRRRIRLSGAGEFGGGNHSNLVTEIDGKFSRNFQALC